MDVLFVYGTLGLGKPNEHILKKIGGSWKKAFVKGELFAEGWGAGMGYPGIRIDENADTINGYVFYSDNLKHNWKMLDAFEGGEYNRIRTEITLEEENISINAFVYVLR